MSNDKAPAAARSDNDHASFGGGSVAHSREDRIAEAVALAALLFSLCIGLVAASTTPSLVLSSFKVIASRAGEPERLVAATQARSGDQLEYQAVYRNPTAATMHHAMVTVPVPDNGVEYLPDTAAPRADLANTDGKHFAQLPLLRVETGLDGRKHSHPAPNADYRFLRWDLGEVPAGASRTVRTRVQLVTTSVASR